MDISTPNLLLNNKTTTPLQPPSIPAPGSNGYLKRHSPVPPVSYKECLKNHAASSGGHALDGCGEFMPSSSSLNCAACGCHRNFHRREPDDHLLLLQVQPSPTSVQHVIEYQPHHRHHPPPPPPIGGHSSSPDSTSPPPISSSYYHYPSSSAPHMLLALSSGTTARPPPDSTFRGINRKRFRTKFTQDQKDRMQEFADKLGWKMQKSDQQIISDFCTNVGVEKNVLKVWMHNNKNNSSATAGGKKENGDLHHYDHPQPLMSAVAAANNNNNNGSSSSS